MIIYIIFSTIAVLLAYLARYENNDRFLTFAFIILSVVWAVRYGWGNDYFNYLNSYSIVNSSNIGLFDFANYSLLRDKSEPLWIFLMKLSKPVGFFGFVIILSIFENWVVERLIRKNVHRSYYWFSVFLYVFTSSYYLIGASMMRQWLAACIVILASEFLATNKSYIYLVLVIIAAQIHNSAFIALLFFPVRYIQVPKWSVNSTVILLLIYLIWFLSSNTIFTDVINNLVAQDDYEAYSYFSELDGRTSWSILGILSSFVFPFIPLLTVERNRNELCLLIFALSAFISPLQRSVALASRFVVYASIFSIVAWPVFMQRNNIRIPFLSTALMFILIFTTLKNYLSNYSDPIWWSNFAQFHTIFETSWQ